MKVGEVRRRIVQNTATNYVALGVRTACGLASFRLLYEYLPQEEFGFWALLWTLFGYGILLDFGLGLTVQKQVAELSVRREYGQLSEVLSTVFLTYSAIGGVLALCAAVGSPLWIRAFNIDPSRLEEFRSIFALFFVGIGLAFPLGLFDEVLKGMQRMGLSNVIATVITLVRLGGIVTAVRHEWTLMQIVIWALACSLGHLAICGLFAGRLLADVRVRPRHFRWSLVRSTTQFSAFAYLIMLGYMLQTKIDLLVIGSCLSVAAVATYQPGAKCGELFSSFTRQLAHTLQPAAAHLRAAGETAALRSMLVGGTRYSFALALPGYLVMACYLDAILLHLTGLERLDRATYWVGQVLLLWAMSFITTHNVYKRIAVMCGHEKRLARIGLVEAGLNAGMSIGLVLVFSDVLWVALGSLIPTVVIGWGVLWRWTAEEAGLSSRALARRVFTGMPQAALATCGWLAAARIAGVEIGWLDPNLRAASFLATAGAAGLFALAATWRLGLTVDERRLLRAKVSALTRASGG